MTQAPRSGSGSGRNNPRSGGAAGGKSFGKGSKPAGSRTGAPRAGGRSGGPRDSEMSAGEFRANGYRAREETPENRPAKFRSAASKAFDGKGSGASKPAGSGQFKPEGYKAGAPKSAKPYGTKGGGSSRTGGPQAGQRKAGDRAFRNERFGQNLGAVKKTNTRRPAKPTISEHHDPEGIRLQKVMAQAGVASRRVCEDMIREGRVEVDGEVVTEVGVRVDPQNVTVHVDGMRLQLDENLKYYVFNKPNGVVCTMDDPEGRPCISDFLKNTNKHERLFHVGRLDTNTEGLLLLTNDGELANRLTHPSYEVPKTYLVQVRGPMAHGVGAQMREGLDLEDGFANVDSFKLVDSTPGHLLVEVVLHSGRNRIVRRLFDAVGHPVERLVRTQVGPIRVNDQRQGSIRVLGRTEVGHLLASVGL
ncbi:pseudouridine synthase [Arthrobacter sp. zg-Y820]|uniref:pseudouridine synthase n=1 Tax=unclassified Arthrobacter TaxID=235627 RepID=UPI001E6281B8|nr:MULTISPECIES: pseudouridine synthase [unclassified Arthrobacter]MCC9197914.1 rRNA pseudouridine synthase [Arthrobacter sp. zg-Y820]MDK1280781.1 pseudouridine synthase [Arthrobacter sp. zg.Y820]MDK1360877.1 pseudouridine synthase [Arthrobacter sp. zg-Y1219]WIB10593.1 pseudouridine synthase [Arthrobacter sp. zg-Y820]